jgi:phosphoglycolate phosphatase-like HAD superfamily hydrolase
VTLTIGPLHDAGCALILCEMKLVVFDIDGTLLDNLAAEDECYLQALRDGLGLRAVSTEWQTYQHVSDHSIALEAYAREFSSTPSPDTLADTIGRFVTLLAAAHRAQPMTVVRGAAELLATLPSYGWAIALATGAWRRAAQFKLTAAGIHHETIPMATAEDGPARTDIVKTAVARAERHHDATFDRIVAVGDGVWDVEAARTLALPFVGVATGRRADHLRDAGASSVLSDFSMGIAVTSMFDTAAIPSAPLPFAR